jgi:negative regulator of replication initiation
MKTIEVSDAVFDILDTQARAAGCSSVGEHLAQSPTVVAQLQIKRECIVLRDLDLQKPIPGKLKDRFLLCLLVAWRINPDGFSKCDGITKEQGRAIFISRSKDLIERTSESARPEPLFNSGYFVNVQGGLHDFEKLLDQICRKLNFSRTIYSAFSKKMMRANTNYYGVD